MNPSRCYTGMMLAHKRGDTEAATEHAVSLRDWLARGGYNPVRSISRHGVMALCRAIMRGNQVNMNA